MILRFFPSGNTQQPLTAGMASVGIRVLHATAGRVHDGQNKRGDKLEEGSTPDPIAATI